MIHSSLPPSIFSTPTKVPEPSSNSIQTDHKKTDIYSLPREILFHILDFLEDDLENAAKTCTEWRDVVTSILFSRGSVLLLIDNDPKTALKTLSLLLKIKPSIQTYLLRAWSHMRIAFDRTNCLSDLGTARKLLQKQKSENSISDLEYQKNSFLLDGFVYFVNDDSKGSIENFKKVLEFDEGNVFSLYFKAYTHFRIGEYQEAQESATTLLKTSKLYAGRARFMRGASFQMMGEYDLAMEELMESVRANFCEVDALRRLLCIYKKLKKNLKIAQFLNLLNTELETVLSTQTISLPSPLTLPSYPSSQAPDLIESVTPEPGLPVFNTVSPLAQTQRKVIKILFCRATLYRALKKYQQSLQDLSVIYQLGFWEEEYLFFQMASCLQQQNKYTQAIRYFSLSLEKNPKFICSLEERARCYSYLQDEELAEKDSRNAISIHPYIGDFCFRYLAACLADQENFKESISLLSEGLNYSQFHRNSTMLHQRGFQYCFISEWNQSIQDFRMAIQLDPFSAEHYLALADLLFVVEAPQKVLDTNADPSPMDIDQGGVPESISTYEKCIQLCFHHYKFMTPENSPTSQSPSDNQPHALTAQIDTDSTMKIASENMEQEFEETDVEHEVTSDESDNDQEDDAESELAGRACVHAGNVCISYGNIQKGIELFRKGICYSQKAQKIARNNLNHVLTFLGDGDINSLFQLQWLFDGPIPEALVQSLEIKLISMVIVHQKSLLQARTSLRQPSTRSQSFEQ